MQCTRRTVLQQLLLASLAPQFIACQKTTMPLTVGSNNFVAYRFFDVAREQGLFVEQDVRLLEHPSATHVAQSLATGIIDAALLTLDELMRLWERGHSIDLIAVLDVSTGIDVVLARPFIHSLDQLKGRKIAVEVGAVGSIMLNMLLSRAQLNSGDISVVYANVSRQIELYQAGEVDLVISFAPVSKQLQQLGANILFSSRDFAPIILDVVAVNRRVYSERSETLKQLVAGYFRIVEAFNQAPDKFHARLAEMCQLNETEIIESMAGLQMQSRQQNTQWLSSNNNQLQSVVELIAANSKIPSMNIRRYVNAEYLN